MFFFSFGKNITVGVKRHGCEWNISGFFKLSTNSNSGNVAFKKNFLIIFRNKYIDFLMFEYLLTCGNEPFPREWHRPASVCPLDQTIWLADDG